MQNFYNNYREDTSKDENGVVDGDPAAKSAEGKGKGNESWQGLGDVMWGGGD